MKKLPGALLLCGLCASHIPVHAAIVFTYAEATAVTSGNVGNSSWTGTQLREIATPTAGESESATVTRNVVGQFGAGQGVSTSVLSLNLQGFSGTLDQAASGAPTSSTIAVDTSAATSGGAFVEFTLSGPHVYSVAATGQIDGPTSPDNQNIGVQISLLRSSGTPTVDYVLQSEGPIAVNQSGVLNAGSYSFQAAMLNLFEFHSAMAGVYASDGDLMFSVTLTPVPESSSLALAVMCAVGLCVVATRTWENPAETKRA